MLINKWLLWLCCFPFNILFPASLQGRDAYADLRKSEAERFASADGKTSAADRFICGFGQNKEDFDCLTKNMSLQGGKI